MARAWVGSSRSTFRYSRIASAYFSCAAYLSPRSRWRAFWASGDREQATARSRPKRRRSVYPGIVRDVTRLSPRIMLRLYPGWALQRVGTANRVTTYLCAAPLPLRTSPFRMELAADLEVGEHRCPGDRRI